MTVLIRFLVRLLAVALLLHLGPKSAAAADAVAEALERADLQYRIALHTLETSGRDKTAAEVRLFRESLQALMAAFEHEPSAEGDRPDMAALATQLDTALVGALIVIDIGSRDAARAALTPIADTLTKLRERAPPPD